MISSETLNHIYERCDLVDFVKQYVHLKKSGKNFVGLCPFHEEKTPSFSVSPEKQLFYCFGCKEGGNIFSFLQKKENLSFVEAVKTLADSLNIKIEETSENDIFYEINKKAAQFYTTCLFKEEGTSALNYLMNRGLKKETIEAFNLGYTGKGWNTLKDYLKNVYPEDLLLKVGLLRKKGSISYDWTRDRITFPIFDRFNRVVGFGARALDTSLPKYINTKETPIYNKSYILYGLNRANKYIKEKNEVILVEGYIDVIMCHQNGFENVVGLCGTSLTGGHISAIRQAENVVIMFDPDKAGIKASERSIPLLINKGFNVFVVSLDNIDPGEILKEKGPRAFSNSLRRKEEFFDFLINIARKKEQEEGIKYLLPFIEEIDDVIKRSLFIKRLSDAFFIDEDVIKLSLKGKDTKPIKDLSRRKEMLLSQEALLISLMLEDEEIAVWVVSEIDANLLKDIRLKEIFELIKKDIYSKDGYKVGRTAPFLSPSNSSLIALLGIKTHNKEDRYSLALSCIKNIKGEAIKEKMNVLRKRIRDGEKKKEDISEFLQSYQALALSSKGL